MTVIICRQGKCDVQSEAERLFKKVLEMRSTHVTSFLKCIQHQQNYRLAYSFLFVYRSQQKNATPLSKTVTSLTRFSMIYHDDREGKHIAPRTQAPPGVAPFQRARQSYRSYPWC